MKAGGCVLLQDELEFCPRFPARRLAARRLGGPGEIPFFPVLGELSFHARFVYQNASFNSKSGMAFALCDTVNFNGGKAKCPAEIVAPRTTAWNVSKPPALTATCVPEMKAWMILRHRARTAMI
jgi:hypothetical protein